MNVVFHPAAQQELSIAAEHYEQAQIGLGLVFVDEVYAAVQPICTSPEAWARLTPAARRCLIQRFPYGIVYRAHQDKVQILAIVHLNCKPGDWNPRLKTP